jgi:hypothetical protein
MFRHRNTYRRNKEDTVSDNKTAYSGKDYPVHSSGPWMEITIETYGDGHREITIDGKRYWVRAILRGGI